MRAAFNEGRVGLVVFGQLEQHFPYEHAVSGWILVVAFEYLNKLRMNLSVVEQVLSSLL